MSRVGFIRRHGSAYSVTRRGPATLTLGRFTDASPTTLSIVANVQPITGRDLKIVPEGRHADDVRVVFTETQLRTECPAGAADVITIGAEPYVVFKTEPWSFLGGTHCRAYAARAVVP